MHKNPYTLFLMSEKGGSERMSAGDVEADLFPSSVAGGGLLSRTSSNNSVKEEKKSKWTITNLFSSTAKAKTKRSSKPTNKLKLSRT